MRKTNFKISQIVLAFSIVALSVVVGCSVNQTGQTGQNGVSESSGTFQIMLMDKPIVEDKAIANVLIDILSVEIHSDSAGWLTLNGSKQTFDLFALTDGTRATIAIDSLDPGIYTQIRFILSDMNTILLKEDGKDVPYHLTIPSGEETGIKLTGNFEIVNGSTTTVVIDFDAEQSIIVTGSGKYKLKPVVKIVSVDIIEGTTLFFDDFGFGAGNDDITGWDEVESALRPDKCRVEDGSTLGSRMARIYGRNETTNHRFFKKQDMSGYKKGRVTFWARRSAGWQPDDRVYVELFYDKEWHGLYAIFAYRVTDLFSEFGLDLPSDAMKNDFYLQFRNDIADETEYLDIDNVALVGIQ